MKILHFGQTIGGLDIYIRNVCRYTPHDIEFIIVHGDEDFSKDFVDFKGRRVREYLVPLYRDINILYDFIAFVKTLFIVLKIKPDVIHAHSAKGGVLGRLVGFLTCTRTYYTPHAFSFLSASNQLISKIYLILEKLTKFNAVLLACSESELNLGITKIRYKSNRAKVWSNSVPDIGKVALNRFERVNYVCTVGRPSYQKNTALLVDVIAEVVRSVPEFQICILGVGHHSPELEIVEEKIERFGITDNVQMFPWVDQEEALSIMSSADFYISSARYEGLPLAVLEAMSLGKPILATAAPGNVDCVVSQYNGVLTASEAGDLSNAIIDLWRSKKKQVEWGRNSRILFEEKFNIEKNISKLLKIYKGGQQK